MTDVLTRTHYDVLAVPADAGLEAIRFAYRQLARVLHPDRHAGSPLAETEALRAAMAEVNEAWAVLSDPARRAEYDRSLGLPPRPRPRPRVTAPRWPSYTEQPRRLLALLAAAAVLGLLGLANGPMRPNGSPASHDHDAPDPSTTTAVPSVPPTTVARVTAPAPRPVATTPTTPTTPTAPTAPPPLTGAPVPSTTTTTPALLPPLALCPTLYGPQPQFEDMARPVAALCPPAG